MNKLIIIRGLPGAGKSTYAKAHYPLFAHYESDSYFMQGDQYVFDATKLGNAHLWCQRKVQEALGIGDVVVSNTFTTRKELKPYIDMARELGATVTLVALKTAFGSVHNVPDDKLAAMAARWVENDAVIPTFEGINIDSVEIL